MSAEVQWTRRDDGISPPVDYGSFGGAVAVITHGTTLSGKPAWTIIVRREDPPNAIIERQAGQGEGGDPRGDAERLLRSIERGA